MSKLYSQKGTKNIECRKWHASFILAFIVFLCNVDIAAAQHSTNLSDWHVPPPVSPGNTTKGDATGKNAKSNAMVLIPVDIAAPQLPKGPAVQLPQPAAISTNAPLVNAPVQPVANSTAEVTSAPVPAEPEAPGMPQLQLQDAQAGAINMPDPAAPELPAIPAEPLPSKLVNSNTRFPVLPGMIDQVSIVFPSDVASNYFPTPAMPESSRENLNMPPAIENDKGPTKPKKIKTRTTKNKPNRQQ